MKYLKFFEQLNNEKFHTHLLNGNTLYHYTNVDNLDSIYEKGLIPNSNSNYKDGIKAVFLTNKSSLSSANLPHHLMTLLDRFYDEIGDESYDNNDRPIVRLTIDISKLEQDKFYPDDDYLLNKYGWNNAQSFDEQLEESLNIWGTIAYKGIIPPSAIIKEDYDYYS